MRFFQARIAACEDLGGGYFLLGLSGCEALAGARPGQFVMVRGEWGHDPLLPRAFSLLEARADGGAALLIREVGRGTGRLRRASVGEAVMVLGPLGTAFPAPSPSRLDLLVAGGSGVPPIVMQAARAAALGLRGSVEVFLGGRTARDLPLARRVEELGVRVHLTTDDGSVGLRGFVTRALEERLGELAEGERSPVKEGAVAIMACGPEPMLGAVAAIARGRNLSCHVSLEAAMACGLGACLGCAVPARSKPFVHVCKDGPVFDATEVFP